MKKSVTKPKFIQQLLWFVGIYLLSILALAIFHELSQLLIKWIK